tara:strand:- start:6524 stop:6649 length:126 start_codon:yes stop_codon:yes gene_type:complete
MSNWEHKGGARVDLFEKKKGSDWLGIVGLLAVVFFIIALIS